MSVEPILTARSLVKRYGRVTALDHADFDLYPNEILAVIGDNGAGKSTLVKAICGAVIPDSGEIRLGGEVVHFKSPIDARMAGVETVYQDLALSPALSIADNMFLGREIRTSGPIGRWFRALDRGAMQRFARDKLNELGLMTIQNINQPVETLSGGQRQGVAVARAAAFAKRLIIMDEPTAALGVKESRRVLELILDVKKRGLPIILISHNMPHVFELADRIHIHRLGRRLCVIDPKKYSMSDAVAMMTGAMAPPPIRPPEPRAQDSTRLKHAVARRKELRTTRNETPVPKIPLDFLAIDDSWFEYPLYKRGRIIPEQRERSQLGSMGSPPPRCAVAPVRRGAARKADQMPMEICAALATP